MTRTKALNIFLSAMLVLVVVVAPVFLINVQIHVTIQFAQEGSNIFTVEAAAPAIPGVMACDGCSGGGTGPF